LCGFAKSQPKRHSDLSLTFLFLDMKYIATQQPTRSTATTIPTMTIIKPELEAPGIAGAFVGVFVGVALGATVGLIVGMNAVGFGLGLLVGGCVIITTSISQLPS
jgi:hypothetical protein